MNKTFWQILIPITFLLTACGQSTPATQATPQPDQPTTTSSPLPTATPTRTALPSATLTASTTPLPTIPTFTPTFDVSTIVTVTPAEKAECSNPNLNATLKIDAKYDQEYGAFLNSVVSFLNSGGSTETLKSELSKKNQNGVINGSVLEKDLTNDKIPEIILKSHGSVFILRCDKHRYEKMFDAYPELGALFSSVEIIILGDLNKNSIPEILVSKNTCGDTLCNEVKVFEWNAQSFKSLLKRVVDRDGNTTDDTFSDEIKIADFDGNGLQDIIGTSNIPGNPDTFLDCIPCRMMYAVYSWNGEYFVESKLYYSSATYRFQAVQDADRETQYGNFDGSLSLYQDVIFNNQLQPWSSEIALNMRADYLTQLSFG